MERTKTITLTKTQKPFLVRDEILTMYYNDIRKYPVLSQEETVELFRLFKHGSSLEREYARTKLFNHNAKLVTAMARQYCGVNDSLMDLIEEGNIGLLNAINKFDVGKASSFQKFALFYIRREINLFKTNYSSMVQQANRSKTDNKISTIVSDFIQKENRMPTDDEVLSEYNERNPKKKINDKEDTISVEYVYIDSFNPKGGEFYDAQSYVEYSNKTCSHNDYLGKIISDCNKELLDRLMIGLTPNEKKAITLFYGLENGIECSLGVVGTMMNCTSERVRQLCKSAVEKMSKKATNK